jgi:gluconokinase
MGVSGAGKTTWGRAEAARSGAVFIEGDDHHSPEARAKMAAGIALNDDDRWPWLHRIADAVGVARADGPVVATCSALKRCYRDLLRDRMAPPLSFVFLDVPRAELERRLAERTGHYMQATMLSSQLDALEPPLGEADVRWIAL